MEALITALTAAFTPAALWGAVTPVVPVVLVAVIFSLGLHFVRRATGGISKGKAKI